MPQVPRSSSAAPQPRQAGGDVANICELLEPRLLLSADFAAELPQLDGVPIAILEIAQRHVLRKTSFHPIPNSFSQRKVFVSKVDA